LPPSASKPEPAPQAAKLTLSMGRQGCSQTRDLADRMSIAALARTADADAKLAAHQKTCRSQISSVVAQIHQTVEQLSQSQGIAAHELSSKGELKIQLSDISWRRQKATELAAKKEAECKEVKLQLEDAISQVVQARQAVAQDVFGNQTELVFQDCQVSDWSMGPCSKKCVNESGEIGQQVMTRRVVKKPNASALEGRLSAACPATKQIALCNNLPCPIDCNISEWSGWAACSSLCGGGEQYRTRSVSVVGLHGGMACGATTETRACNVHACGKDCTLGDWSAWGPCARRCLWQDHTPPGHAIRMRPVLTAAEGSGKCPSEEKRRQYRECNPYVCPKDLTQLRCTADQDILVVLDGSGSVTARDPNMAADRNFNLQKQFMQELISNSAMPGPAVAGSSVKAVRFGVLVFGGSQQPQLVSPLSGDGNFLSTAISKAAFPGGITPLAPALAVARRTLQASVGRHGTVVVLSDGRFRSPEASVQAARSLRREGARVVIILVQVGAGAKADVADITYCKIASTPCVDNVLRVNRWEDLSEQITRFLSVICPVGFSDASDDS